MSHVTVAICTYQRCDLLGKALASLAACEPIQQPWELLVVDNGGDPKVQQLTESLCHRLPAVYVAEPELGHSRARNRAIDSASAPVVLFTDDDVTFDRRWLVRMVQAIGQHDDCDFWGGRIEAVWGMPKPTWYDPARCPMLDDVLVHYDQGPHSRRWEPDADPPFFGANLAVRVEAVRRVGYFDTSVGHRGAQMIGGDDSLMIDTLTRSGSRGWYVADALVFHPVPPQRITRRYARQFAWRQGWISVAAHRRSSQNAGQPDRLPRWFYRVAVGQVFTGCRKWIGGWLCPHVAERFAGQFTVLFNLSKLWHALKGRRSMPGVRG